MTKIKLQSIAINNFKGIRFLKLNFEGKDSIIQGANGSGKTTIYKAYYWCLTGKTIEPNETVQTLDQDNEIVHKIETSVEMTLLIDDSYEVILKRTLTEKWKAKGMPNETFDGTEQKQFFNEIPFNKKEFEAKLNGICDLEKWILLSNINTFMQLKAEDRRKMLISMAGEVDEQKLMKPYPAVMKAVNVEKKNIEELQKQVLSTKKRSNDELKTIPSQIDAQDRLKVNENFEAKKKEIISIEKEIADIDRQLEGSNEELESAKKHREEIQSLTAKIAEAEKSWRINYDKEREEATIALSNAQAEYDSALKSKEAIVEEQVKKATNIKTLEEEFDKKKAEWEKVNLTTYTAETLTACPVCGHVFTEEEKIAKGNAAIEHFNADKSEKLKKLLEEAGIIKQQITALTGSYNEGKQIILPQAETLLASKQTALNEKKRLLEVIKGKKIENDGNISKLKSELSTIENNVPSSEDNGDKQALRDRKKGLTETKDALIKILAGEETNRRIEEEKEKLNKRAEELAQIVADCDNTLYQIMEYKKAKINAIESKINSFFQIAQWKFFRKNIGDDNFTEVCDCLHNGVDYNSTNAADKINLGVDIVSSIGKAYGIEAVIFVDFRESVADLLKVDNQVISLEHVANATLTLNN